MKARSRIRMALKEITDPVHQRLHGHEGLAAVASQTIGRDEYRILLARLYGFHRPFDAIMEQAAQRFDCRLDIESRKRARSLELDLQSLGLDAGAIDRLATCTRLFRPATRGELMGALYVVEGSTLGGLQLARALSSLFGPEGIDGRRFFFGYGESHSAMWQTFLNELDACDDDGVPEEEIFAGAIHTFGEFETWMNDWRDGATTLAGHAELASLATR